MAQAPWLQVGLPTLDRPFGLALWPIFAKSFETLRGYAPESFNFVPGKTPMASMTETAGALAAYYIIIFGGRELMKERQPMKLNGLFKIHNFYLTLISGVLLLLYLEQLIPTLVRNGTFYAICDYNGGWTPPLVVLYYLNYLTKYLELLDTVFLFLKKKPLTFLHTYHHGATALLCYTQLLGHTAVSWVPIVLNLTVHVVMYWYYFQSARGIRIWWKKYITMLQIAQFVIDLGFIYFASYTYFSASYFPWLPTAGICAGEEFAAFAGMAIITSYLVLFIGFYISTYKKPVRKGRGRATSALVEMKDEQVPDVREVRRRLSGNAQDMMRGGSVGVSSGKENGTPMANGRAARSRKA
ncbi:Fatty acyl-CoA elongase/Polyunsaturated fatty acid specific elongation enzyme [Friedmanniomyces endolithicus]|nr:Fatty acyl-CoA elongase/Polyunsaturated fatty acid specific elongation enzyme [Friedmanniomyces endolithicus]KAK0775893.1 Fatty acyl-CoA elongase/Polyunsaturated fatty acid specific elongation enzyme [Friedmanniomyces endolithicus]KAK0814078.1 Fatty acyl-CoA elongase/Polyunsaturated fatty acid specific elongation enzyme [Friedmanniomyces endolithicus]KAK0857903.1 Fatty acyl-CoA elongase/Polyunsaturated fatty acid specific elongation enzyme [Friedmanniomyces endolithicus]KAK0885099.1 Fatty ac